MVDPNAEKWTLRMITHLIGKSHGQLTPYLNGQCAPRLHGHKEGLKWIVLRSDLEAWLTALNKPTIAQYTERKKQS